MFLDLLFLKKYSNLVWKYGSSCNIEVVCGLYHFGKHVLSIDNIQ